MSFFFGLDGNQLAHSWVREFVLDSKADPRCNALQVSTETTNDEGEVIALYQLRYWYGRNKTTENTKTQKSHCHTDE